MAIIDLNALSFGSLGSSVSSMIGSYTGIGLSSLSSYLSDIKPVQIYANGAEKLGTASIMACSISETAQLAEHPLESGAKIADHKVFQPIQVTVTIAFTEDNYLNEYSELRTLYLNKTYISMKTKTNVYENLQIVGIPHDETPERVNRMLFTIQMKEALVASSKYGGLLSSALNSSNNSTAKYGSKQLSGTSVIEDLFGWGAD